MLHKIKISEPYADAVYNGEKTFEVRLNDRGYNAGDVIEYEVIDDKRWTLQKHPLNKKRYDIVYVHSGIGMQEYYVVFGIKPHTSTDSE